MDNEPFVYLSWKSPSRLFKKRDKEFFRNIAAIVFLLLVILFVAKEFPLILAVVSVTFLVYVFSTIAPEEIPHTISNLGIDTSGRLYRWEELSDFWFDSQWGTEYVVVVTKTGMRLILLLSDVTKDQVKGVLVRFLHFIEEPQKTVVDKAASWLSNKVPLEKAS